MNSLKQQYPALFYIVFTVVVLFLMWGAERLNHLIFKKIQQKKEVLHLRFFEGVNSAVILIIGIILAFSVIDGVDSIWKTLLGGTAILSAVIAFAAQDVIKDILAGLMISVHKPFEVGDRIELEDGTAGIVKDISLRHVVLQGIDTNTLVIPNSRLNAMKLVNYSFHTGVRSVYLKYYIAYNSDVEKAMEVIRKAVMDSPLTMPGDLGGRKKDYGSVYFIAYETSSLQMATTVFFSASSRTEDVISDVNLRVNHALAESGIEVPYPYVNVISRK